MKAFISYSWDSDEHRAKVKALAGALRRDGIDVTIDQWNLVPGDQLPRFMETSIRENDYILIVCTEKYKKKTDNRIGGAGYEGDIMTGELLIKNNRRKFIPILFEKTWETVAPTWLMGSLYIDLSDTNERRDQSYHQLLMTLLNQQEVPSEIGDFIGEINKKANDNEQELQISGQYRDNRGTDIIYFRRFGNIYIGIYDYAQRHKFGYLLGKIEDNVYKFRWKWLNGDMSGFGHMKVLNANKLLNGFFWYQNKDKIIEHVGYIYHSDQMPSWLTLKDFDEIIDDAQEKLG